MNALIVNCSPVRNGATAAIAAIAADRLRARHTVREICIADYRFAFCTGCRSCHDTGRCALPDDGVGQILGELEWADAILFVAPSYWADIPGQFKAFIDRCTPWSNTHEPHAAISRGKRAYTIALRTGARMRECDRIIESIEHFCGHMEIEPRGRLGLCGVASRSDVPARAGEIEALCDEI